MVEQAARSTAGSPLPRWGRRLLFVAAAGVGAWLVCCLGHQASAQAEIASPQPLAGLSVTGSDPVTPPANEVRIAYRGAAEQVQATVKRLNAAVQVSTAGLLPSAPAMPPGSGSLTPAPGDRLLSPPAGSRSAGAVAASAGRRVRQTPAPHSRRRQPAPQPVVGRSARTDAPAAPGSHSVLAVLTDPAPHPRPVPVPGPGAPVAATGGGGQAPGSPYSLPLAEPPAGAAVGHAGLASAWAAGAAGAPLRTFLPDTPPG